MFTTYTTELNLINQQPFIKDEVQFNLLHRIIEGELGVALYLKDKLIALQNKGFPLVVWLNNTLSCIEKQELLKELYQRIENEEISVISSTPKNAAYLVELYKRNKGYSYSTKMNLMSYYCPKINNLNKAEGFMRLANKNDIDIIAEYCVGFILDGLGKEVTKESQVASATRLIEAQKLYVWQCSNEIVTMANMAHKSSRLCRINNVYTPPHKRGRGYATALMVDLSQEILASNLTPVLFTDLSNPISNKVYQKVGYLQSGKIDELKLIK